MYNETYDEYIRSILGYPSNTNSYNNYQDYNYETASDMELEKCYPEIYKIIYPMITKKCNNVRNSITNEEIEDMTDEIYYAIEANNEIQLNINLTNNVKTNNMQRTSEKKPEVNIKESTGEKRETRQINRNLRDLIKILIIRELLNRPGNIGRPPRPRPPMPGPRPPVRPPFGTGGGIRPFNREFEPSNYDIFEY